MIIGVPNATHIFARVHYLLGKNIKRYGNNTEDYKYGLQPPDHIQFFNKTALTKLLEKNSYKPVQWSYHQFPDTKIINTTQKISFGNICKQIGRKFYTIEHPLFSVFFAVKAIKL